MWESCALLSTSVSFVWTGKMQWRRQEADETAGWKWTQHKETGALRRARPVPQSRVLSLPVHMTRSVIYKNTPYIKAKIKHDNQTTG